MSRTDKDAPEWVRAEWWEPVHLCHHPVGNVRWRWYSGRQPQCTLPDTPTRQRPVRHSWRTFRLEGCHWRPVEERDMFGRAPKWFEDHVWLEVTRTLVRDQLRLATKQWHGSGEVEIDPDTTQHRHRAAWLYW